MNAKRQLLVIISGVLIGSLTTLFVARFLLQHPAPPRPEIKSGNYSIVIDKFKHDIVLFTNSFCEFCKKEKKHLDERGISYLELVIDKNTEYGDYMFGELNENAVPLLFSRNSKLIGYHKLSLDEFFKINQ